jgi:hypothetical protein
MRHFPMFEAQKAGAYCALSSHNRKSVKPHGREVVMNG